VIGEVFVANAHLFKSGLTVKDYIDLSGGANEYADEDNIYLIKADGSIVSPSELASSGRFFRNSSSARGGLQPGDTVVVPLEVQPFSALMATTEITQIVYQMALAAAAVNSF
jgi:protein involved in polysaccharide export with SLBB domain